MTDVPSPPGRDDGARRDAQADRSAGTRRDAQADRSAGTRRDAQADLPSRPRAGILVTGTEVLTGIIADGNGPWLSERLVEEGVDAAMIQIVGDRPEDLLGLL